MKQFLIIPLLLICFTMYAGGSDSLNTPKNPYNLEIISTAQQYKEYLKNHPDEKLVNLEEYIPNIKLDIRYATTNNFTKTKIYSQPVAYLVEPAAKALKSAQKELNKEGLGFVIYDAYRPYACTLYFMEVYPDTTFVASPRTGSIHNRGCAVDLALVNLHTGEYLTMPTEFDSFTPAAAIDYQDLSPQQIANRKKLIDIMVKHGFSTYSWEWWHFNLKESKNFKLKDLSLESLGSLE